MSFLLMDNTWIFLVVFTIIIVLILAWISTKVDINGRQFRTIVYISEHRAPMNQPYFHHRYQRFNVATLISQNSESENIARSSENISEEKSENEVESFKKEALESEDKPNISESININVKIKHLNDNESIINTLNTQTISDFKKNNFPEDISNGLTVRLIFNGQELKEPNNSLHDYGIKDNSTIHCLITKPKVVQQNDLIDNSTYTSSDSSDLEIGTLLFPLFGALIAFLWYIRIFYRHYFNVITTFGLIGVTILYLFSFVTCLNFSNHLFYNNNSNNNSSQQNNHNNHRTHQHHIHSHFHRSIDSEY